MASFNFTFFLIFMAGFFVITYCDSSKIILNKETETIIDNSSIANDDENQILVGAKSETLYGRLRGYSTTKKQFEDEYYDYIIVGAGAAGCPLARTLSDSNLKVLLLERGPARTYEHTPLTMDIYGAGLVINDKTVSQVVSTTDGVRTHIGSVMGGGTSINVGIVIEEVDTYFDYLEKSTPGIVWDKKLIHQSFDWVSERAANKMPEVENYGPKWAEGLENNGFTPYDKGPSFGNMNAAFSDKLQVNHSWRSFSVFNSTNGFFRDASDVLLITDDGKIPSTLTVKPKKMVEKIEFDTSNSRPKATCVVYRTSTELDNAPIMSFQRTIFGLPIDNVLEWLESFINPFGAFKKFMSAKEITLAPRQRACIYNRGEIIISAGALLTPALLFKSGLGPIEQLQELGVPNITIIPKLGKELSDRVLIPVGVFFKDNLPSNGFPPRICQAIGAKLMGPDCSTYSIGKKTLECSLVTAEELSGAQIAEGIIYSTRYIIPPEWRDDPLMEYLFSVLTHCSNNRMPFNSVYMAPLCALAKPVIHCFRKVAANFYFTAEPKSRGSVRMQNDGRLIVDGQYLRDEQDLFDAVRGVSNIINIVNSDVYKDIIEPLSKTACPALIMNGMLDMILQIATDSRPTIIGDTNNFEAIIEHMEDLIPKEYKRERRVMINDEFVTGDIRQMEEIGLDKRLLKAFAKESNSEKNISESNTNVPDLSKTDNSNQSNDSKDNNKSDEILENIILNPNQNEKSDTDKNIKLEAANNIDLSELLKAKIVDNSAHIEDGVCQANGCQKRDISNNSVCYSNDIYDFVYGCDHESTIGGQGFLRYKLTKDSWFFNQIKNKKLNPKTKQWAATYPPVLPDTSNPVEVAKYALSYMTSIWHHTGTAKMGEVVDNSFNVIGVDNLSIIDASVLNVVPRMNPTATLMMLGRYAGKIKIQKRMENCK